MYLLDTNICIYILRERSRRLQQQLRAHGELGISAVTYGELCFGIENGPSAPRGARWEQLRLFVRQLLIEPLGEEAALQYGRLRAWLRREGTPIGNNDLFIAAHALALNATLVTNNERGFARIPDLRVENWV